tara:strand:- start:108 stop:884 length:777 start_codon:yes stop_codon:yes gene_type:complete
MELFDTPSSKGLDTHDYDIFERFHNREVKAKHIFEIKEVTKVEAYDFVKEFHYLSEAKFFAKYSYGLFINVGDYPIMVGCASYSNPQGISSMKGWFGLPNSSQDVMELSRLCVLPELNGSNASSYLLGNSIKHLKNYNVKAVITLADASRHVGSIYQVCNFSYYGLTSKKTDFYCSDGRINPRGKTKNLRGVWLERTRKHRYCYILDKNFTPLLSKQPAPKKGTEIKPICCEGESKVYDNRFGEFFDCPKCFETKKEK